MSKYKTMYLHLFNAVTDALERIGEGDAWAAAERLKVAQQECEELYMDGEDENEGAR